ncbi:hypothetical protein LDENG_00131800 [Lucifuga dentata]|nr:hypothetical protein LDENG_00131800 [Lucifuga dentata]
MGNKLPNSNLIRADANIGKIADKCRATCRDCDGDDCRNNILEDILEEKILTSGYFGIIPFFSTKPKGKCSHGDDYDQTRKIPPKGGINKDTPDSSHGHLHSQAANVAIAATSQLLEDIRRAAGDIDFLRMLRISKGSGKPLCFVIDTTGSMTDDIEAVKRVTSFIISSKVGTEDEPSVYILVPFSDPDFGPLKRTKDPEVFQKDIDSLSASGGGDFPEMSLSALQLALTGSPPGSEIFVFTDATAKDSHLKDAVIALIEQTKSVVNFMLTDILGGRHRRQTGTQKRQTRFAAPARQLYRDLAQASGGLAIEVTKSQLPLVASIITESTSSPVTILYSARNPGGADNFTFSVDESITNLIIYITGHSLNSTVNFTLIRPSGESQQNTDGNGSLITSSLLVGNFQTLWLNTQVGQWEMTVMSSYPYTLKVTGQSPIDFLFDFLEPSGNIFNDFDVVDGRPRAGGNGTVLVTVTGSDSITVTEVTLVESSGSEEIEGTVESQGDGEFLARFDRIPSAGFMVRVKGWVGNSSSGADQVFFERQSPTSIRHSTLTITVAEADDIIVPGTEFSVLFSVTTSGTGEEYFSIRATNDQGFNSTFPSSLYLENGDSANGTVNLTVPLNTPSGSGVTLTIEAEDPRTIDTNYVVLHFIILKPVTDITPPVCQLISLQSNCSDSCSSSMWELSVNVTDGLDGSGINGISLMQGSGTMNISMAVSMNGNNITLVSYHASCCSPDVELVIVDQLRFGTTL